MFFRLVHRRSDWNNTRQHVKFRIDKTILDKSKSRKQSNGIFLWSRYQDQHNLYVAGVRVDGQAVIKRKSAGEYKTLAFSQVWSNKNSYYRDKNPQLIPENQWFGLRLDTITSKNGEDVELVLYIDKEDKGKWQELIRYTDTRDTDTFKGPIFDSGHVGIRSDFMEVSYDNYIVFESK